MVSYLLELLERRRPRLVGELARGDLDHGDAEAPHVGAHVVLRGVAGGVDPLGLNIACLKFKKMKKKAFFALTAM